MNTSRVQQYWEQTWGLSPSEFSQPGFVVCPHSEKQSGRNAAWLFLRNQTCIISSPPALVNEIESKSTNLSVAIIMNEEVLRALFGDRLRDTVGPAYQGFVEKQKVSDHIDQKMSAG